MTLACLRVLRFRGTGLREHHELALCVADADSTIVTYADGTHSRVRSTQLQHHVQVTSETFDGKATVRAAVTAQLSTLKNVVAPMHEQIFQDVQEILDKYVPLPSPSKTAQKILPPPSTINASESIRIFGEHEFASEDRFRTIKDAMQLFSLTLPSITPSSFVMSSQLDIPGFKQCAMTSTLAKKIKSLCQRKYLKPPSAYMKKNCKHFLRVHDNTISYLCLSIYNLNRTPGSVCVSVELAISEDKNHAMSGAITSICKNLRRRKNRCILFTQVADTEEAIKFWKGRLTHTKRASAVNGLLSNFNKEHKIYADTTDMAIFFE